MGRKKFLGIVLGLVLFLTGCATMEPELNNTPKINQEMIKQNIVYGQTTKQDVLKVFGSPDSTSTHLVAGQQYDGWIYQFAEVTKADYRAFRSSFLNGGSRFYAHQSTLIIMFDQNGVVSNYTATSNYPDVKTEESGKTSDDKDNGQPSSKVKIDAVTMEKFSKIQDGMSYKEVAETMGGEGVLTSQSHIPGAQGDIMMYSWSNSNGTACFAVFNNDKLWVKS